MKAALQVLFASLAAGSVLPRGSNGHNESAIPDNDFVYVDGLRLYNGDGLYYLTGNDTLLFFGDCTLNVLKVLITGLV
jgi:mannan endo-1,4-beta-mannosidase